MFSQRETKNFIQLTAAIVALIALSFFWFSQISKSLAEEKQEEEVKKPESEDLLPDFFRRRRPGGRRLSSGFSPFLYEAVPDIRSSASDFVPVPNRWKQFYVGKWYDPYNQNILKGDLPVFGHPGHEWFLETELISDSIVARTKIALPVGIQSTRTPGRINTLGNGTLSAYIQNFITSFSLIRGNTTFKPPEYEFRVTPVISYNHVEAGEVGALNIDPARGTERDDSHFSFLELFADVHLADISPRYDFISSRMGIQEFNSDFRGFVYEDSAPGVRLFGNWDNNKWQGNLAWFSRLDKETNSFQNTFDDRHEDVFIANLYHQDMPTLGHQVQASIIHRIDTAGNHGFHYDDNGFLRRPASIGDEKPKNIYSTYFGLNADGHIDRVNTTSSFYYVTGSESHNPIAGQGTDISAFMLAQELSYDINWIRLRGSAMWASGDSDPFDGRAEGFDAIFDTPNFAGGDLSFWQSQGIPLIGGGEVFLTNQNSLLANFRAGKQEGQSNFVNPGIRLVNIGADFELMPTLKLVSNASYLQFDETAPLQIVRQDGSFSRDIGYDLSAALIYRPWMTNNVQIRTGASCLIPKGAIKNLYGDETMYNFFTNLILEY